MALYSKDLVFGGGGHVTHNVRFIYIYIYIYTYNGRFKMRGPRAHIRDDGLLFLDPLEPHRRTNKLDGVALDKTRRRRQLITPCSTVRLE